MSTSLQLAFVWLCLAAPWTGPLPLRFMFFPSSSLECHDSNICNIAVMTHFRDRPRVYVRMEDSCCMLRQDGSKGSECDFFIDRSTYYCHSPDGLNKFREKRSIEETTCLPVLDITLFPSSQNTSTCSLVLPRGSTQDTVFNYLRLSISIFP